jgi:TonB-linked SusC/RagA family outer membrane protein
MMKKLLSFFCFFCGFILFGYGQSKTITGRVTDQKDGSALPGVSVTVTGVGIGTQTNINGVYTLNVPTSAKTLTFRYVGYATQVLPYKGNDLNVKMFVDEKQLSEVVVVGYGTQSRRDVTGSVASVTGKETEEVPVTTFEQALQGRSAGVNISAGNGKLGQAMQIQIRGTVSITSNAQPLVVVDGVIMNTSNLSNNGAGTNPLADINFDDVESYDILKDAASKAIFGSQGANGVILITTKKGKSGASKVNFSMQFGDSKPSAERQFLNAQQYVQIEQRAGQGAANQDYLAGVYSTLAAAQAAYTTRVNTRLTRYSAGTTDWQTGNINTNWQDQVFQKAPQSQYDLNVSGGNEKTTYFASGQLLDQKGIIVGNAFKRYAARFNVDTKVFDNLKFGANLNFSRTYNTRPSNDDAFSTPLQIIALAPITPLIDPRTGLISGTPPGANYTTYYNPLINVNDAYYNTGVYHTLGNVYGAWEIVKGLTARSEFGLDQLTQDEESYFGRLTAANTGTPNGQSSSRFTQAAQITFNNYLNYKHVFSNVHSVDVTAGTVYQYGITTFNSVTGQQFPSDAYKEIASAALISAGNSTKTDFAQFSYFARANYAYQNKYLLTINARYDGSSRFGINNRYGFFPGGSLGWLVTDEDFMKSLNILSTLKLRASYGLTGNNGTGNYAALGLVSGGAGYNGVAGQSQIQIANPDLKWEKTKEFDLGFDFGILKDRISGTFDYYKKNTDGLLLNRQIPQTTGFSTQVQNFGSLYNQGLEFSISTQNLVGKFRWSTSFNMAYNKNTVTNIGGAIIGTNDLNRAIEGLPVGVFYGAEYAGVNPANGDALYFINSKNPDGSYNKATTNDYSQAQSVPLGNPTPKITGGITNTFSYRGVDLSVTFQGVYGNKLYNGGGQYMSTSAGNGYDNQTVDQMNYWNKPGDITDVPEPRLFYGNGANPSSRYLTDGSYLRCKTVTLGYTVPKSIVSKVKLDRARIFFNAYNLFTITHYKGWDPEVNADYQSSPINQGVDFYSAPQPRTITFGVNIGL